MVRLVISLVALQITNQSLLGWAFAPLLNSRLVTKSHHHEGGSGSVYMAGSDDYDRLDTISDNLNKAIAKCQPEFIKTCKVKVGRSPNNHRLGLIATDKIKKGDVALAIPYDDQIILTPESALTIFKDTLPKGYDGWTGDNGLLALLLLNELARTGTGGKAGIQLPKRKAEATSLIDAWIASLPSSKEMSNLHPIMWDEDDQEILQSSSTKKIYRVLDDIDDDATWLNERVWSVNKELFPEKVTINGEEYECFTPEGFSWAVSIATSRAQFVDGTSRIVPLMDMANHNDIGVEEVRGGSMGTFGTTKGIQLRTSKTKEYKKNEEVFVSYGPKSAAEYCLDHGFIPNNMRDMTTSVAELTFELDEESAFYDDVLDILEFETYENAPMEPKQSFDLISTLGRDGEPDPAMIQFLRLIKIGTKDAFLLESVFRNEVWEFMSLPVSEGNEKDVLETIISSCTEALTEMEEVNASYDDSLDESCPTNLCAIVRESESKALSRTLDFVQRDKDASDLKEYYQERRLKDLGLNSDWNPDEASPIYSDDDEFGFDNIKTPSGLDF
jgi:[ribulose-bisphosphate carboxylase]-lysine N-methyltransferase